MPAAPVPAVTPTPRLAAGLLVDLLLIALIALGVYFRFTWTNWSQGTNLHPDEYGLTGTLTQLKMPKSLDEYFNTRLSPISPYPKYDEAGNKVADGPDNRMRWGQWPIILLKWAAELTDQTGYNEQRLLGRSVSALADTLALLVIAAIGARLFNRRVGLLAAALSALAVMQIQQSHFMTSDTFGVLFTALTMYAAVRAAQSPPAPGRAWLSGWPWYALFGVFFGMTLASRINLAPLAGLILVAALAAHWPALLTSGGRGPALQRTAILLIIAGFASLVSFRVTHPMAFRAETGDTGLLTLSPNPDWTASLEVAAAESSLRAGGPPAEQWTSRPWLIFPWVNMVLWGMGLPLGLAAWAGFAWALWKLWRADWVRDFAGQVAPLLLPMVWVGGYFLFMGTRWVMSVRYFLPIYPFLALLAAWALTELGKPADAGRRTPAVRRLSAMGLLVIVLGGTLAWAWGFTSIYRTDNTRIQAARWVYANVPAPVNLTVTLADGSVTSEPLPFFEGTDIEPDTPFPLEFRPSASGTLTQIAVGRARNAFDASVPATLQVTVAADPGGQQVLGEALLAIAPDSPQGRGSPAAAPLNLAVEKGQSYYLLLTAPEGWPVRLAGAVLTNENWDEGLPMPLDGHDPFGGLYRGLIMEMHWLDNEDKRQMLLTNLEQADYIVVQSQRRLWASSRLPGRYPMLMEYYRALFDGRLGFELAAQFQSPIVIGPLQVSDLAATWAWGRPPDVPARGPDYPFNFSLFAAEEAFSVYDHAPVWIFRKRADFNLDQARALLNAVDLTQVVDQAPRSATLTPTRLMLPADLLPLQRAGGTWSAMFDAGSWINTSQPLAGLAWYLALLAIGGLAFPLTFAAFGGLPDKGYPLAKTVALLVVTWLVWMAGSLRLLPYTRGTIALGFLVLGLLSLGVFLARRAELVAYVRGHWRHILGVEAVGLALFGLMLLIRWGNPDLWHPYFGGEKPMDFSYFNAVLKSSYFPPYDPWLAGGYLNYYYYGFVVAGLLTKLLGVMPSLAYNLILPMLFSLVGVNAFCVAYNLVAGANAAREQKDEAARPSALPAAEVRDRVEPSQAPVPAEVSELGAPPAAEQDPAAVEPIPDSSMAPVSAPQLPGSAAPAVFRAPQPPASPYLAGVAAALLIVVFGNLGQIRTYLSGFQKAADRPAMAATFLGDTDFAATLNGMWRVFSGQTELPVGLGSWYWDATRIIPNINGGGSEITEFPFFTFLYADLHAHMIVMPFTVMAIAWAVGYLQGIRQKRRWWESAALWALGGLVIGVTRPSNTWDYPMYLALGASAILGAHWLAEPRLTRRTVFGAALRLALLVGLTLLLYRPFDQWVAVPLTELKLWEGERTPLEAYFYIYGLFLFLLVTVLVIEARRWLAATPATVLRYLDAWAAPLLLALVAFAAVTVLFMYLGAQVALVALPLMLWAALLLLRRRLAPEKRAVFFLLGTGLAVTVFVDLVTLGGDRMNTVFKLSMQVWMLFSVAAGAAFAWAWADRPAWSPNWRAGWAVALAALVGSAALYTVTAASAKMRDRFV
ncbi:MAG: glycosyltransferase family 39 protein, partial [Anaerolineales bacterium]|nr:glycosyltransferase family 39 protein [Anaerolineales bacterium]